MTFEPENDPSPSESPIAPPENPPAAEQIPPPEPAYLGYPVTEISAPEDPADSSAPPLFRSWEDPSIPPPPPRIPHVGHLGILLILATIGFVSAGLLTRLALHFHLWGVSSVQKAVTDIHYTLASMAILYFITFAAAILLLPLFWDKGFFAGLQWNASAVVSYVGPLAGAAGACFILAMIDELVLPGPTNAPIDQLFKTRTAAWLMFAFGITLAPFFEEIVFRGFILPALCTAYDWGTERISGIPVRPLGPNGHPRWSVPAMVVGSILTSIPFAAMHAEQNGHSLGPFVLLVCVSLVLCFARLATRSLAASVFVHASYNFILFALMLVGTGGFKHLDKM